MNVTVQSELGDRERLTSHVKERPVHLSLVVGEDSKVSDLSGQNARVLVAVAHANAKEDEKSGPAK